VKKEFVMQKNVHVYCPKKNAAINIENVHCSCSSLVPSLWVRSLLVTFITCRKVPRTILYPFGYPGWG